MDCHLERCRLRFRGLKELAILFLRLGLTAFGGPAVHIAMMEEEVVRRRGWLHPKEFLDLLGAVNLIPGPNSTELAIHIGYRRNGWPGLFVAGSCFILPAMAIVTAIAMAYVKFGALPEVRGILYGIKPVIIAIIAQALWRLGGVALKNNGQMMLSVFSALAVLSGLNELLVLLLAGMIGAVAGLRNIRTFPAVLSFGTGTGVAAVGGAKLFGLWPLFLFFLKTGSVLFGSGYVLLAFLRADLVERWHWLSQAQLLDAVAVGQVTPGPVFTTATFIGYILGGLPGAVIATVGIFLPAFVFVAVSGKIIPRIRNSRWAGGFLDGVNIASLALMGVVMVQLLGSAITDGLALALAVGSAILLFRWRVNSVWLVLGGAIIGWVRSSL